MLAPFGAFHLHSSTLPAYPGWIRGHVLTKALILSSLYMSLSHFSFLTTFLFPRHFWSIPCRPPHSSCLPSARSVSTSPATRTAQREASKQAPRYASPFIPSREGIRAAKVRTVRPAHPSPVRGPGIRFKTAIAEPRPARLRSQSPQTEDRDTRSFFRSENARRCRHRHRVVEGRPGVRLE